MQHSWLRDSDLAALFTAIEAVGGEVRVVGGAIRDALLGREVHDVDLAVNMPPDQVGAALSKAGFKVVPTGIAHGTLTIVAHHKGYEITTLRHDIKPDGRHTQVEFTDDWAADAARRDFTFNALYANKSGVITDYFDGRTDLEQRCVRFIGDPCERIREDVLRILRLFRFYAQIDDAAHPAHIEPKSLDAACELAHLLSSLSAERTGKEIVRLLASPNPLAACRLMEQGGVFQFIFPAPPNIDRLVRLIVIEKGQVQPDSIRRLAALLSEDVADDVAQRLRFSKVESYKLRVLSAVLRTWGVPLSPADVRQKIYDFGNELARDGYLLLATEHVFPLQDVLNQTENWLAPKFPLQGKDIHALVTAGPQMGEILKKTEKWWRDKDFAPDKAACLDYAKKLY